MSNINQYLSEISSIFKNEKDRYEAHRKAAPVLKQMGADREVLYDIFRKNLSNESFINRVRHYPTLAFEIYQDKNVAINGNCFMPLPDRSGELSFQSIHHHGKLLLTTVAAFGPGYESILFKKGFTIDTNNQTAEMAIEKKYQFVNGNLEFIDADQPHIVFFPSDASITYAMWAYTKQSGLIKALKDNMVVKKFKGTIRVVLKKLGLLKKVGLNAIENLDFYPENGKIKVLKNRLGFREGTNENFLTNVFYVLQKAGFKDSTFLNELKNKYPGRTHLHQLIDKLLRDEPIRDEFYDFHMNVKYVNLSKSEILSAVK